MTVQKTAEVSAGNGPDEAELIRRFRSVGVRLAKRAQDEEAADLVRALARRFGRELKEEEW